MINKTSRFTDMTTGNFAMTLAQQMAQQHNRYDAIANPLKHVTAWVEQSRLFSVQKKFAQSAAILGIAQSLQNKAFNVPDNSIRAIDILLEKQFKFFNSPVSSAALTASHFYTQQNAMLTAVQGITAGYLGRAIRQSHWGLVDEFERINDEAAALAESIAGQEEWTDDHQSAFAALMDKAKALYEAYPQYGKYLTRFINIFVIWATFHMYYDFVKPKPEPLSSTELQVSEHRIQQHMDSLYKQQKAYHLTALKCRVLLKPNARSLAIGNLPDDYQVAILQIQHKWAYVSYTDPSDNLLHAGWILKKYLRAEQKSR